MIDGWFLVLIVSLILALGGLAALLIQSYRGDASAAWRELLESVKWRCGMVPNPGERLRIRALNHGAICRLGKIFKQDVLIDRIRAAQERCTRWASAFTLGKRT